MEQYNKVFVTVGGQIDIDTRYSPKEYLEMLSETQIYNADIINICNGLLNIVKLPKITISEERFRGDYIDFLSPSDLDAPMTRGIDPYNRPFISFRYRIRSPKEDRLEVETMFQRYTYNSLTWTTGGNGREISMGCSRITCDRPQCDRISERLSRLLHGKPVGYMRFDNDWSLIESQQRVTENGFSIVSLEPKVPKMPKDLQDDVILSALEMRFRPGNGGYSESLKSFNENNFF